MSFFVIVLVILVLSVFSKVVLKLTTGWDRSYTSLIGKTAIVTGANTGIGYVTALEFAKRGGRVILACRNEQKAENARKKIIEETGNRNVVVKLLDLSSLKSVHDFAEEIIRNEQRLDILVNNAGAGGLAKHTSGDGLDLTMQINYFSNFLLTNLLIDLLKKSSPSRIVNVSSYLARTARLDPDNLNKYDGHLVTYSNTKLCNILFTIELSKKLAGSGVCVFSVHPGVVYTDIYRRLKGASKLILDFIAKMYFKTSEEGAQTTIYCSLAKNIEELSGEHFHNCKKVERYKNATSSLAKKVWTKSEEILEIALKEKLHME